MSKTVSARLQDKKHEELRERCNQLGCTMNDFVKASVEYALDGESDFDFGDNAEESKETSVGEDKFQPYHDSHGNYYTYNKDKKIWTCHLDPKNVKIIP